MIQKYLTLGVVPELRNEPSLPGAEVSEVELALPVDLYWEVQRIVEEIRSARSFGKSPRQLWARLGRLLSPYILAERERLVFREQLRNRS